MAVATAGSNLLINPYDEMVVPALRKRLEAESRLLTSRLSGSFDAYSIPEPHNTPSTSNRGVEAASGIPASKSRARVASPDPYNKPSSIPRPSLQMSAQYAQSTRDLLLGANGSSTTSKQDRVTRSDRIPQQAVMRDREQDREKELGKGKGKEQENRAPGQRARSRTQSTPYACNELVASAAAATAAVAGAPSVLPTPASSRANSPQNQPNGSTSAMNPNGQNLTASALSSRPSGIPVPRSTPARPSAKTPRSRSRNATTPVTFPTPAEDGHARDDLDLQHLTPEPRMRYPPSPEPSPELSYIRNVQAPFPLSGSVMGGGASDSDAGRSSFERDMRASRAARRRNDRSGKDDRGGLGEIELNYRGDTRRNGGRGEVYKGHTEEQLEIATFGHDLSAERKALNTGPQRRRGELDYLGVPDDGTVRIKGSAPSPNSKQHMAWGELALAAGYGDGYESGEMELHDESVIRERPLTWMVEGEASVTDLVLQSLRNEGGRESVELLSHAEEAEEHWELAHEQLEPEGLAYEQPRQPAQPEELPIRNGAGTAAKTQPMKVHAKGRLQQVGLNKSAPSGQRAPESSGIASKKDAKTNGNANPAGTSAQTRQRVASKPNTPAARQRVASKPSKVSGPAVSAKANAQPRSKSQPINPQKYEQRDSNASMSLADAIPDIPKRGIERGRNWDEVVLPTVAKQLGLDKHDDDLPEPEPEEVIYPPAPGTFDYDHSKYRAPTPSDTVAHTPRPLSPQSADGHLAPPEKISHRVSREITPPKPPVESPPVQVPPRISSPAPFASYSPLSERTPVQAADVKLQKSSTAIERSKDIRQSKPPKIKISPPAEFAMEVDRDEEKHTSGCKCVVM